MKVKMVVDVVGAVAVDMVVRMDMERGMGLQGGEVAVAMVIVMVMGVEAGVVSLIEGNRNVD